MSWVMILKTGIYMKYDKYLNPVPVHNLMGCTVQN